MGERGGSVKEGEARWCWDGWFVLRQSRRQQRANPILCVTEPREPRPYSFQKFDDTYQEVVVVFNTTIRTFSTCSKTNFSAKNREVAEKLPNNILHWFRIEFANKIWNSIRDQCNKAKLAKFVPLFWHYLCALFFSLIHRKFFFLCLANRIGIQEMEMVDSYYMVFWMGTA